ILHKRNIPLNISRLSIVIRKPETSYLVLLDSKCAACEWAGYRCDKILKMNQVCYYAIPRAGSKDPTVTGLPVTAIDPFLCTHIILAFASVVKDKIVPINQSDLE
ncbi:hypothetical protein OTU49_001589, partial [Cherax quadricarinatus]